MRPRADTFWHSVLPAATLCLQRNRRGNLPAHQKRWQPVQPGTPPRPRCTKVLVPEMLFADDAAITAHTETALQELINCFAHACLQFGLKISIKKTNILGQDVSAAPSISIGDCTLDVVEDLTYLGSNISSNLSRAEREDRQGFSSNGPPDQESVGEHHAHHQDQAPSVSGVRAEHTAVR